MKYWIITDTHFNHKKMQEYCGRPENVEELIKKNLSELVRDGDILIHLGDVCIGGDNESNNWFKTLKSRNILVRGNHDSKSHHWYMHNGWDLCVDRFDLKMFGERIAFTHVPIVWDENYSMNIHGHFHNSKHRMHEERLQKIANEFHKLLAIENTEYKPVLLEKFVIGK